MNNKGMSVWDLVIVTLLLCLFVSLILGYNSCDQLNSAIKQKGVKGVLTEVWEGPENATKR